MQLGTIVTAMTYQLLNRTVLLSSELLFYPQATH
jgi:hypothetical protein